MNIKDIIKAEKTDIDHGEWKSGHIPRSAFPMSKLKNKRYRFGPEYKWRVVKFTVGALKGRVLILLNEGKEIYRARLAIEQNNDLVVLCDHEYHANEPGWHCHFSSDELDTIEPGAARSHTTRWPQSPSSCSKQLFAVSEKSALTEAADRYRFHAQGTFI